MTLLKKMFAGLFVLLVSTAIFYFLIKDQNLKTDILRTTLDLFGKQLFAVVPEGEQKVSLQRLYDDFMRKAENQEVPPEEIERVAAAILNLANRDTVISADVAMSALALAPDEYAEGSTGFDDVLPARPPKGSIALARTFRKEADWEEMAKRLRSMHEFNFEYKQCVENDSGFKPFKHQIFFVADSGLRVAIGVELQTAIARTKAERLRMNIQDLEQKKWVFWEKQAELKKIEQEFRHSPHRIVMPKEAMAIELSEMRKHVKADSLRAYIESRTAALEDSINEQMKFKLEIKADEP